MQIKSKDKERFHTWFFQFPIEKCKLILISCFDWYNKTFNNERLYHPNIIIF